MNELYIKRDGIYYRLLTYEDIALRRGLDFSNPRIRLWLRKMRSLRKLGYEAVRLQNTYFIEVVI
jgi:hypothetical protein